jgi:hypothetical protein
MALTQYNQFEPKLDGLEGNEQAQPRVFAHDAVTVVIGAINNSDANHGLNMTSGGNGGANPYVVNDTITLTTPTGSGGGAGNRAVITVTEIDANGLVTNYTVTTVGALYLVGDTANQVATTSAAGTGFTALVTNTDIPNTQRRGCCLYVGGAGDVDIVLESGNSAIFAGVNAGSFLPVLVKNFTLTAGANNTTATNILALY